MRERYTQEEVNEILLRAVERQPVGREVTREQMESLAAEIGVSPDALRAAEEGWLAERLRDSDDRDVFLAMRREHQRAVSWCLIHLCLFLFMAFIFMMVLQKEDDAMGVVLAIMVPWSIALAFHGMHVFRGGAAAEERAFRKWQQARHAADRVDAPGARRMIR